MQLGFVSAILGDQPLETVLEFAADEGFDCVELMCWPPVTGDQRRYAGVMHVDCTPDARGDRDRVRRLLDASPVRVSGLGYYPNLLSPDPAETDVAVRHLQHVIAAASELNISLVNTFVGRDWTQSVEANWPRMLETWRPILQSAADCGVRLGIENCPMLFTHDEWPGGKNLATTPAIWQRMFRDLPDAHWGLNYDPSHLVWQQIDYVQPLREFAERLFHIHAKDVRIDRERLNRVGVLAAPLEYHVPKIPGLGEIDWGRFVSVLTDIGYRGPVCVEVEDRAFESTLADRHRSLRQSLRYLRNYITPCTPR